MRASFSDLQYVLINVQKIYISDKFPFIFHLVALYRPSDFYSKLLEEFRGFISDIVSHCDDCLIIGGFNFFLNKVFDPPSKSFMSLTDSGFIQFVHEPTPCSGKTLDLILSYGIVFSDLTVTPIISVTISDRSPFLSNVKQH